MIHDLNITAIYHLGQPDGVYHEETLKHKLSKFQTRLNWRMMLLIKSVFRVLRNGTEHDV